MDQRGRMEEGCGEMVQAALMFDFTNRYDFLSAAILFEGSLIGVAGGVGWWFGVDPLSNLAWDMSA